MKTLAIVPARGGSKGIKGKNKRLLHGKSLTYWALNFATRLHIDEVCLTSDDPDILSIADSFPSVNKVIRPDQLSGDRITDRPVLVHAMNEIESRSGIFFERLIMLQPTSPGRNLREINEAMAIHLNCEDPLGTSVWSVTEVPVKYHPKKQITMSPAPSLDRSEPEPLPRQSIPKSFIRNGDFYILGRKVLDDPYLAGDCLEVFTSKHESINIDELADLESAQRILTIHNLESGLRYEE